MPRKSFRDLDAWVHGVELADAVYGLTANFPEAERAGLAHDLRRAAATVPAAVAHGHGRGRRSAFLRQLSVAHGTLCELETLLVIGFRRQLITREAVVPAWKASKRVRRMIRRLADTLKPAAAKPAAGRAGRKPAAD